MKCRFCCYLKTPKHGCTPKGHQRFKGPKYQHPFSDTLDTLYYRSQLSPEEVQLQ